MKYRLFLIIATSVVLGSINTSCSRDNEPVASDGDQKAPISFNVNIGTLPTPTVTTRGYTTNSSESGYTFNGDEYVAIGLTHPSGSEVIKQYLVGAGNSGGNSLTYKKEADGTTTGNTFDWLSTTETGVSIRAWSDGVSTTASTPVVDPDGHTFTVETTQSGNVKELLYSPAASHSYTTSAINIPLYHQLSRIVVTIIRENTSNAISSVTIGHDSDGNRVPITGTFTKPGSGDNYGSWSVATETSQSTHWSVITPKEETTGSVYSAVVIPTTYTADMRLFNITIGTQTFAYNVPTGGKTFEAGKQYNYTITVGNKGITVTSNITDWTDAVDGTNFTHGDGLAVLKNVKMSPLWYVATGNMTGATTMGTGISSSLFSWGDAMSYFSSDGASKTAYYNGNKTITGQEGSTWHLPVLGEWWSIVPLEGLYADGVTVLNLDGPMTSAKPVIFGYNAETKAGFTDYSYWKNISAKEVHAIRFLGTDYCSAWKYKLFGSGTSTDPYYVVVSTILIDYVTIADASTWYTNNFASLTFSGNLAVERSFYPTGLKFGTDPISQNYQFGYHWSATQSESNSDWIYVEGFGGISTTYYGGRIDPTNADKNTLNYGVRLFRDN